MKLNVFRIGAGEHDAMVVKFGDIGLELVHQTTLQGWEAELYFSSGSEAVTPSWLTPFLELIPEDVNTQTNSLFACCLLSKDERYYALSFGKAHFYIRPYADYDFGIDVGKRVCDAGDARHVAGKRYQGRRRKDIKSFTSGSPFDVESGESIEYLDLGIAPEARSTFGKSGKFGTSAQLTPPETGLHNLGTFMSSIEEQLKRKELFKVPRTTIVTDPEEIAKYDTDLIAELRKPIGHDGHLTVTGESYDLWGVDFVFPSTQDSYELRGPGHVHEELPILGVGHLKRYIREHGVADDDLKRIKVVFHPEEGQPYRQDLWQVLDYIAGKDLILTNGKWMRFNQDYLESLDAYLTGILVEEVDPELAVIQGDEGDFNASDAVKVLGYEVADKNFHIVKTSTSTPIEAWDLRRDDTVYIVKFGSGQKLGVACDQAVNLAEILRNEANILDNVEPFAKMCLWFGYKGKKPMKSITKTRSIILKQKIDNWARTTREMGWTPVLKISHHTGKYPTP